MFVTTTQNSLGKAEAFITFRRGRKKIYSNKFIYLNDQDEFEIELFNGLQEDVLVKITFSDHIDNNLNQKGLLLYPGQRVFLDRFLENPNKFKFSTYKVENSTAAKHAISKNGEVKIEFFTRQIFFNTYSTGTLYINTGTSDWRINNPTFTTTSSGDNSYLFDDSIGNIKCSNLSNEIETGKINQGNSSNQKLVDVNDNSSWNYFPNQTYTYQILPNSEKPVEIKEIKKFCTQCGANLRNEWKFCSSCGTKC